ncbi:DUF5060 domain-containing protein [Microbacteriaceae bacterium VKM Ac-2855]|nr:DUF5060 domain-containing protein [Microbacteriaceae bacterium VKM Ac-2855]
MGPHSTLREALASEAGRAALGEIFDAAVPDGVLPDALLDQPTSVALAIIGVPTHEHGALYQELARVPRAARPHGSAIAPNDGYDSEDAVRARVRAPLTAEVYATMEVVLEGPSHGNPFVDVELWAEFTSESGTVIRAGGFYDGDGIYRVRFLPEAAGPWSFRTGSTAHALDGLEGVVEVEEGRGRGVVRVDGATGFAAADGTAFTPYGTTIYAWTHQSAELQEQTLATLEAAAFTKVRMCVFPKSYPYSVDDPELVPFEATEGGFDTTRFVPAFFRHLEQRIRDLDALGIEADVILFHPYDRWGFADLGQAVDERYLRYVVRRLASLPNVWWSLANEYDLISSKDVPEWHRLAGIVRSEDHADHLLSIHNGLYPFDYTAEWATHASLQRCDSIRTTDAAGELLRQWGKPVVFDEMGYEGDLEPEWGNVPGFEVVRQFWEATVAGAYVTHGETFWREDGVVFWAKGGRLTGDSPARIAFLAGIVADSPSGRLGVVRTGLLGRVGGVAGVYEVLYLGLAQPRMIHVTVPAGRRAEVDIIDTWAMTIETVPGHHEGRVPIGLPSKPYLAVRVRVQDERFPGAP